MFSDSVFSLASREAESISLSSAIVLSSSDLMEREEDKDEGCGKGQEGVIGVETGEGVMLLDDEDR